MLFSFTNKMKTVYLKYLILGVLAYTLTSLCFSKKNLNGRWGIETVIYEGDTLYSFENLLSTTKLYGRQNSGYGKTKEDIEYEERCIRDTFSSFMNCILEIKKDTYSQTEIKPCWDHINFSQVRNGEYSVKNDSLTLYQSNNKILMSLKFDESRNSLSYVNKEFEFRIHYRRIK